jgi:hypothetical protein
MCLVMCVCCFSLAGILQFGDGWVLQTRQSLLPEEINDLCFVDVKNNKDVFESLKSNVKVAFDGQRFAYKV